MMGNSAGVSPSLQASMKTGRFLIIVALASVLASVGANGGGGIGQRWPGLGWHTAAPAPAAVKFRTEGACPVPILSRAIAFKGGATTGEEVTLKLDTSRHTYEIRIDASKTPGRQGMLRHGKLLAGPARLQLPVIGRSRGASGGQQGWRAVRRHRSGHRGCRRYYAGTDRGVQGYFHQPRRPERQLVGV